MNIKTVKYQSTDL